MAKTLALRWRMLVWLLPLTLILAPCVAYYAYRAASAPLNAQADGTLQALARVIAQAIERSVAGWVDATASLADSRQTREAMTELRSSYRSLLTEMGPVLDEAAWARIGGALRSRYERDLAAPLALTRVGTSAPEITGWMPGKEGLLLQSIYPRAVRLETLLASADTSRLAFARTHYAAVIERNEPVWKLYAERNALADLAFADVDGTVLYTLRRSPILGQVLLSPAHRASAPAEAFRAALLLGPDTGHPAVSSDAAASEWDADEPSLWIGSAITDDTGRRIGVLLARISLVDQLDTIVSFRGAEAEVGLGTTGVAVIIGADGKARSNYRFVADLPVTARRPLSGKGFTTALRYDLSNSPAAQRLLRKDRGPESGLVDSVGHHGQEVRAAYTPLRLPDLPWGLIVQQDRDESVGAAKTLARNLGIGATLAMLALTLYAFAATHSISAPLASLARVADAVGSGNDIRAKVTRRDEIGRVGEAMNRMLDTLASNRVGRERELREMQDGFGEVKRVTEALGKADLSERANITEGPLAGIGAQLNDALDGLAATMGQTLRFAALVAREAYNANALQTQLAQDVDQCGNASMRSHDYTSNARLAMQQVVVVGSAVAEKMEGEVKAAMEESVQASEQVRSGLMTISDGCRDVARRLQNIAERAMAHDQVVMAFHTIVKRLDSVGLNMQFALSKAPGDTQAQWTGMLENLNVLSREMKDVTERLQRDFDPLLKDIAVAGGSAEEQAENIAGHTTSVDLNRARLLRLATQVEEAADSMRQLDRLAQETDGRLTSAALESHVAAGLAQESLQRAQATKQSVEVLTANAEQLRKDAARYQLPGLQPPVSTSR